MMFFSLYLFTAKFILGIGGFYYVHCAVYAWLIEPNESKWKGVGRQRKDEQHRSLHCTECGKDE